MVDFPLKAPLIVCTKNWDRLAFFHFHALFFHLLTYHYLFNTHARHTYGVFVGNPLSRKMHT
jgi:dipeptide/tripeptide permease